MVDSRLNAVEAVLKRIETAKRDGWNLLIPSIPVEENPDRLFVPVLETIMISTDQENGKEIYKGSESGYGDKKTTKYRLHATALKKIANAGAVKWDGMQSGFVKDEPKNSVAFRAVGGVIKADGDIYQVAGYYDIDFDVMRQNLEEQYQEKTKKYDQDNKDWWKKMSPSQRENYTAKCVDRDFRQKRQFSVQMAETGARNRVIRDLFQVKAEYTMEELKRPFLVLRYKLALNYQDPMVRQIIIQESIRAALGVFGPSSPPPGLPAPQMSPIPPNFTPDPNTDPNLCGYGSVLDPEAPPADDGADDNGSESNGMTRAEADFKAMDKDEQMNLLREMADRKGFKSFKDARDSHPSWGRMDFFKFFSELTDAGKE